MNLLLLTADYPPHAWSGVAAAVECQARALARLGLDVHVLTRASAARAARRAFTPDVRSVGEGLQFPWRGTRFDCVHLHSLGFAELAFEISRRTGAPVVYTAHSLIERELEGDDRSGWTSVQHAVMDACEAVVFVSEADRTAAIAAEPGLTNRSRVVRNGVPPPPASARVWRSSGPIVYAGRFTRRKGIDLLGEIAPSLARSWSGRFVIAGGHGDADGDRVVGRLRAALGDALDLPGWLSRVALDRLFASAALVLVPSRYEPFGLVPLEAMRLGAPVLAARVGGLAENVTAGSGGRLVDSHDPDAWCRAALAILDDPATGEELSRRGPAFVAARFNARQPATQLIREVYMPLCCRAEARRPRTAVPRRGRWLPAAAQGAAARRALRW